MINSSFFKRINCALLICKNDPYSTIVEADNAFYKMVGYTKKEMFDLHKDEFAELVLDDVSLILKKVEKSVKGKGILDYEFKIQDKSGKTLFIHDIAMYDREENVFNIVITDVSCKEKSLSSSSQIVYVDKRTGLLHCNTLEATMNKIFKGRSLNDYQDLYLVDLNIFKKFNALVNYQIANSIF